jgi:uncharacterized protein (UPF0218 family)
MFFVLCTPNTSLRDFPYPLFITANRTLLTPLSCRLEPFDITVVDLKTGAVATNLIKNQKAATIISLPKGSIYEPAREAVESAMRNDKMADVAMPAEQ